MQLLAFSLVGGRGKGDGDRIELGNATGLGGETATDDALGTAALVQELNEAGLGARTLILDRLLVVTGSKELDGGEASDIVLGADVALTVRIDLGHLALYYGSAS